ncbi:uncharacterized protein LOC110862438 [Folsomia candida]|nr:uncharacterized protein LOC110862438 [Folsomia candida]
MTTCMILVCILTISFFSHTTIGYIVLNSPVITNYGKWESDWNDCDPNMYVRAIDVRSTPDGGELIPEQNDGPDNDDNLGMTSISLECAGLSDPNGKAGKIIVTPRGGTASAAELPTACEGFAIGFQLLSDDPQIALDNTGANNIRIYCSDMKDSATQYVEGYGDYTGQWTDPQFCKERQAICGIKSQVQTRAGPDQTGINNVRVKCCDIPSPAKTCVPTERWELAQECDNVKGKLPIECTFYRSVGIGMTTALESEGANLMEEFYRDSALGFGMNSDLGEAPFWLTYDLSNRFATVLDDSETTGQNWTKVDIETWALETSTVVKFNVKEGYRARVEQMVGSCGYYSVKTPRLKHTDYNYTLFPFAWRDDP